MLSEKIKTTLSFGIITDIQSTIHLNLFKLFGYVIKIESWVQKYNLVNDIFIS